MRIVLFLSLSTSALAADWPAWRGAGSNGVSTDTAVALNWSRTENVKWKVDLPEPGNSTPIVWKDSILITQPKQATGERLVICLDRETGKRKWSASVPYSTAEPTHATNPYASSSAATDGQRVIAWFGSAGLFAFDFQTGKQIWKRDLGIQKHTWGYASTPVIHKDRAFLNFGPGERSFLLAFDVRTGKTLWQVDTPQGKGDKFNQWSPEDMFGSWSTPLIVTSGGREELIVTHPRKVLSYDPATGKTLWSADGLGDLVYPSPVLASTRQGQRVIIAASGFQGPSMVVSADGSGKVLWRFDRSKPLIGSAVSKDGFLYWADIQGVAQCIQLATGEVLWAQRLPRAGEDNGVWSSPVLVGDRIYVMNKSSATLVFRANPERFEELATNPLGEPSNSSVVIAGGDVFLRTHHALWCIRRAP
ncbi:MAG: PQQ-like beta-propeller repeat protein [Candidatus Solibacter usitatus]|nr:PQQ-like beta-propeller repeat protein [Candidatus Solibacter usitatus]